MSLKNCFYVLLATISLGAFVACDDDNDDKNEFPKVIKVENVSVNGNELKWNDLLTPKNDTVYIVNSDKELQQFRQEVENLIPTTDVDYTKSSVLILGGTATSGIDTIAGQYIQTGAQAYNLSLQVRLNETTEAPVWAQAIVVPKLDSTAVIGCKVIYTSKR